jgi:hypothetical protein
MTLPGLVAARNLADAADRERAWDNLGLNISANFAIPNNFEPEAAQYIAAVEAVDEQALEQSIRFAINNFVLGCKADGIWPAIKASCILAGARTLNGALVPLVGTAPTNFNFVSGDYNRKTGLVGNGTTKYLDSNRNNNADPQNNNHNAVYASTIGGASFIGAKGDNTAPTNWISNGFGIRNRSLTPTLTGAIFTAGLIGASRSEAASYLIRANRVTVTSGSNSSDVPDAENVFVFSRNNAVPLRGSHRLAFYSIGESLDLAFLDARVTDLINAFAAAIP